MSDTKKNTVDCSPTWVAAAHIYLNVMDNKNAPFHNRQQARNEILRMAQLADKYADAVKAGLIQI